MPLQGEFGEVHIKANEVTGGQNGKIDFHEGETVGTKTIDINKVNIGSGGTLIFLQDLNFLQNLDSLQVNSQTTNKVQSGNTFNN